MTKRRITRLPPLETVAFLFPGREFMTDAMPSMRFRARYQDGNIVIDWRRFGDSWWVPMRSSMMSFLAFRIATEPNWRFVEPIEIEDEDEGSSDHQSIDK